MYICLCVCVGPPRPPHTPTQSHPQTNTQTLWKEFRFRDDEAQVLSSEINWKDTPQAKELQATLVMTLLAQGDDAPEDVQPSFFSIFHKEDRDFALGDMLKGDVYANPLPLYMSVEFKEEEGEEGEEGEEEEGEGEQ